MKRYFCSRWTLLSFSAIALVALGGVWIPGLKGAAEAQPGQTELMVTEVTVGAPTPELLRIVGRNLDNGPNLDVTLGEFPGSLAVVSATETEILAVLPVPLAAGDYLLTVSTGGGSSRQDVYGLTVQGIDLPLGAIILWDQSNSCPDGFTQVVSYDGRFLMASDAAGMMGGSNLHRHGVGSFTVPPHRHSLEPWDGHQPPVDDNSAGTDFNATTGPAEGGTLTGASELADSRPEFVTILLCRKTSDL